MLHVIKSAAFMGLDSVEIRVEVNISNRGLPQFNIVGLAGKSVDESRHRIMAALQNSGLEFYLKKITVNLAPADIAKNGSFYDLPIAVGMLCHIFSNLDMSLVNNSLFYGELSLDGCVRSCRGSFIAALHAASRGYKNIFLGEDTFSDNWMIEGVNVVKVKNLLQLKSILCGEINISLHCSTRSYQIINNLPDMKKINSIIGQLHAKRALTISAAGCHNLMFVGPPGVGKTLLANSLPSLLPPLTKDQSIEITRIYSVIGLSSDDFGMLTKRPFRSPHHSVSFTSMFGGGVQPIPGEVTLAHNGVLFLDEFGEFDLNVIEGLRKPLEEGAITITRHGRNYIYPSNFTLVAASNPCPCGFFGHPEIKCRCSDHQIDRYRRRFSGPLLDRIDLYVTLSMDRNFGGEIDVNKLRSAIYKAREMQFSRYREYSEKCNGRSTYEKLTLMCLDKSAEVTAKKIMNRFHLSFRAYTALVRVARTIADLEGSENILEPHILESAQYRFKY